MQIDSTIEPQVPYSPERELWAAVMAQAVDDLGARPPKRATTYQDLRRLRDAKELRRSAKSWFLSVHSGPGTFLWICNMLDLDPSYIRSGLRLM